MAEPGGTEPVHRATPAGGAAVPRETMEPGNRVVENTLWQFVDRILRLVGGFAITVAVVRYLGPESFGRLSYAVAFVSLLSPLANLGLDSIVIRELVRRTGEAPRLLGTSVGLKTAGGLVALAAAFLLAGPIVHDTLTRALIVAVAIGPVFQALDVIDFWFQSRLEMKWSVLARDAAFLAAAGLRVGLILAGLPLLLFAWANSIELALGAAALAAAYALRRGRRAGWSFDATEARALLRDAWPFIFSNAMIMLYMRIDQLMIGQMVGATELGVYSVAVRLTEAWYFIPMAIAGSLFPDIVRARASGDAAFEAALLKLYRVMALVSYAVAIPTTLLAGPVIHLAFGDAYARSVPILQVLVWSFLWTSLGVARSQFLTAMNWAKIHLVTVTLGAATNIALNLLLIPRYGALGAAYATFVAYWLAAHGSCFLIAPLRRTGVLLTRAMVAPRIG